MKKVEAILLVLWMSVFATGAAASSGMWLLYVHMCGSQLKGTEEQRCVDGTIKDKRYVSKAECERAAQEFVDAMERLDFKILSVRCVEE